MPDGETYAAEIDAWHAARLDALMAEDGWLNLTDRVEIAPGRHRVGRSAANDLVLSAGPDHLGTLLLEEDGTGRLDAGQGFEAFEPVPDNPPRLRKAGLLLELTAHGGQHALRVRDLSAPAGGALSGIPRFPLDPAWRIVAGWEPLDTPQGLQIDLVKGLTSEIRLTHRAQFRLGDLPVTLLPTHWKAGKPMFVFRDATSGRETYGAARFLIGDVQGKQIVLDFNTAFNPPCAFTEFAICPLPPPQNVLPVAIRAGERSPVFSA